MNVRASVDGKIALTPEQTLMQVPSAALWNALFPSGDPLTADPFVQAQQAYRCGATLEGANSLVPVGVDPEPLPDFTGDPEPLYEHFLPHRETAGDSPPHLWFVVVDGRGRVRWSERHPGWDVLALVCRSTPADYLASLRENAIDYLVTGEHRVDLPEALRALRSLLGVRCLVSSAGGELNAALLRAGLVDELVLTVAPAAIGGAATPGVLGGPALATGEHPVPLRLLSVHTDTAGLVRLHYAVGAP